MSAPLASMEGRAIARPNRRPVCRGAAGPARFNGGPGNCPAKLCDPIAVTSVVVASMEGRAIARPNPKRFLPDPLLEQQLQWRAGQLPGQTGDGHHT